MSASCNAIEPPLIHSLQAGAQMWTAWIHAAMAIGWSSRGQMHLL